jgi:hypothetical protein
LAERRAPGYLDRLLSASARAAHEVAGDSRGSAPRSVRARAQIRWGVPGDFGVEVEGAPLPAVPSGPTPRQASPTEPRPFARQAHIHAPAPDPGAAIPDGMNAAAPTPNLGSRDEHRAARPRPAPTAAAQPRIDRLAARESQAVDDPVNPLRGPTESPTISPARSAARRDEATPHAPARATHAQAPPDGPPAQTPRNPTGAIPASRRPPEGDAPRRPRQVSPLAMPLRPHEPRPTPPPAHVALRSASPQLHIGTIEVTIAAPAPSPQAQVAPIRPAQAPAVPARSAPQPPQRISRPLATYGLGQW